MRTNKKLKPNYESHLMSGTTEYHAYFNMLRRCYDLSHESYMLYKQKGITVCPRWLNSFKAFIEDMGPKPSPDLTLDRIDNKKGYSPDNCRWASRTTQQRNRDCNVFITWQGKQIILVELARLHGISDKLLRTRIMQGMPLAKALIPINYKTTKKDLT